MSVQLKFYYDLMSQPARALYMFLKLNQIPHEPCYVNIGKGEHLTNEYAQNVNPFRKIPAIVTNDFKLSESVAIYRYLAKEYKIDDAWYPKDIHKRARVDEYLEWQHLNTRLGCSLYFVSRWLRPFVKRETPNEEQLTDARIRMLDAVNDITNIWLKDRTFLTGNEITIADLVAATEIEQLVVTDYDPFEGRPTLKAWIEAVKSKANPHYEDAHKLLYRAAEITKAAKL